MLGTAITEEELRELICQLKKERYVLAAERLEECTDNLLSALEKEEYSFKDCYLQISQAEHLLHVIKKQLAGRLSPPARQQLNALTDSMEPLWSALLRGGGPPGMTTNITACSICPDTRPSCLTIATAMFSLPT